MGIREAVYGGGGACGGSLGVDARLTGVGGRVCDGGNMLFVNGTAAPAPTIRLIKVLFIAIMFDVIFFTSPTHIHTYTRIINAIM